MERRCIWLCLAGSWLLPAWAETHRLDATTLLLRETGLVSTGETHGVIGGFVIGGKQPEPPLRIVSIGWNPPRTIRPNRPVEVEILLENPSKSVTVDFPATRDLTLERTWGQDALVTFNPALRFTGGGSSGRPDHVLSGAVLYGVPRNPSTVIKLKPGDRLELRLALRGALPHEAPVEAKARLELLFMIGPRLQPLVQSDELDVRVEPR